eukprot:159146-Amphidinium_carterae.1
MHTNTVQDTTDVLEQMEEKPIDRHHFHFPVFRSIPKLLEPIVLAGMSGTSWWSSFAKAPLAALPSVP